MEAELGDADAAAPQPLWDLLPQLDPDDGAAAPATTPRRGGVTDVSLNMWGDCRPSNYAKSVRRARLFKPARVALFARAKAALESAGIEYALYGGSALSVHREAGRMIAHDSDVDLAVREADFARLAGVCDRLAAESAGQLACDAACSLSGRRWFADDCGVRREVPYAGVGCKRVKLSLTEAGWAASGLGPERRRFPYDPCLVHLDVFTVSPHPLDPAGSLRVNWSVPGIYDSLGKRFPADCLFPPVPCVFEGVATYAPRHLAAYLTVEYGYLGRDAMYHAASGLYVKIPAELRARLPGAARARMTEAAAAAAAAAAAVGDVGS